MGLLVASAGNHNPWEVISRDEFLARQARVRAAAHDVDAVLIWSRGGGFIDMHADVLYLTNHYSQYAYIGEEAGLGSGRAHTALLLPRDGPSVLTVDVPWWNRDLVVADRVEVTLDPPHSLSRTVKELNLHRGRIALVGTSYMTASTYLALLQALPDVTFVRADRLVADVRIHKSVTEINLIRRACDLGNEAVDAMMDLVVPGQTEATVAAEAAQRILAGGGVLYDAACASGPWSHHFTYARMPSADASRPMEVGDLFHVDCYGAYGGYFFDLARSRAVGDRPSAQQRNLLEAVIDGVMTICSAIRPGLTGSDVYRVGRRWVEHTRFVRDLLRNSEEDLVSFGHGIGLGWESPWLAQHDQIQIEPNMYLAVEVMLGHPRIGGAMFEHSGLVSERGFEVLSTAQERWW